MTDKNFNVYKSSAGSGKTFTLVKEYLALALNDPGDSPKAYRHILAVTFTNKAAAEMKERIIRSLKELAEDDYSKLSSGANTLLGILKEHRQLNAKGDLTDEIIRKRSKNVLTAILHNYSDFAIGTIDSFVHRVVRTFAFDLGIPMSFEIEMDDEKLLEQAIDLLIAKVGSDEKLTRALVEFTESKTDDEKSWHIENDLKIFAKNLLNEEGAVSLLRLKALSLDDFFAIKDVLYREIKKFETAVMEEAGKAVQVIKNSGLSNKDFYYGDKGIAAYFEKLANGRIDAIAPNTYVQAAAGEDKWYAGKITDRSKSAIDGIKNELLEHFMNLQVIRDKDHADYILFSLINKNIYSLAVLNEIEKLLNEYKSQNNILHISEFNKMIARIVLNEPVPFIYERLGERYNNYLIDEFQDTSVLQFQNLLPLIDNSLASGFFTMLVGDGKQAIYRWRGGEVEQFAMLPEVFRHEDNPLVLERQEALIRNYDPRLLNKNFRSRREVIEFNNAFFRTISEKLNEKYKTIYDGLEQEFDPEKKGGFVQVEFLESKKEEFREQTLVRILEIVNELRDDGYKLKDISILVRKNTDGSDVANFLSSNGIPVISSDSLLLSNSVEVNFVHAFLKYLSNTNDVIVQTELLEYLVATGIISHITLEHALENRIGLTAILREAEFNISITVLSKMALYELCEELIRIFGLSKEPNAYIQFFLDEVLNYSIKKNNNLEDFIEYWEEKRNKASLIVPLGMDAVSIMTIHRSKGLEFPAVILPFSNSEVSRGKKNLWVQLDNEKIPALPSAIVPANKLLLETPYGELYNEEVGKSLLDNVNVLYVGFTRAEERMYVIAGQPSRSASSFSNSSDMLAWYFQTKGEWQEGKTVYTEGNKVGHVPHKAQPATLNYELSAFNSGKWRDSIKMRAAAPGIWNTNAAEVKKDYGVMVHTALSRVKAAEDIVPALESMCGEGLITLEELSGLQDMIADLVGHDELKEYYRPGLQVKNEVEIVSRSGESFRLDRVVLDGNSAVIIDYKTGKAYEKHKAQIREYAALLAEMGYIVEKCLLVYTDRLQDAVVSV
ncbi:MAG: UvrD-helicase domain-containing protein [Bacteroidia bacterium]